MSPKSCEVQAGERGAETPFVPELQVIGSSPDCAVGLLQNYVFLCWRREVVQEGSTWARKAILEARRARPADKVALFTVVEAGCSVSTPPEVRTDLAAMFKKHAEHLAGGSITFEGKGFQMTMVRSIVTAINMASRTQFPNAVFGDIAAAAAWLSARAPSLHVPEILSAVDQLRK